MEWVMAILLLIVVLMLVRLEWRLKQLDDRFRVIASALTSRQRAIKRAYRSDSTPTIERPRTTIRDSDDLPRTSKIHRVKRVMTSDGGDADS